MSLKSKFLCLSSYVEGRLLAYILDRFRNNYESDTFSLHKRISVLAPFGKIKSRDLEGHSQIVPEICVFNEQTGTGVIAEAVAWDDDAKYGNTQSESHQAMHEVGLPKSSVYFAQKIICQLLPIAIHVGNNHKLKEYYTFLSCTENHILKMESVLKHLVGEGLLQQYYRPLEMNQDIAQYDQGIYELVFPKPEDELIRKIHLLLTL